MMKTPSIIASLAHVGLEKVQSAFDEPLFSIDKGDYLRVFSPQVIRKKNEVRVLGVFGLTFCPFEVCWKQRNSKSALMVSLYASNLNFLMSPPNLEVASEGEINQWFATIRSGLELFPATLSVFLEGVQQGQVGPFPLNLVIGDRRKFAAFLAWVRDKP